jgi:hypothetical protein
MTIPSNYVLYTLQVFTYRHIGRQKYKRITSQMQLEQREQV